MKGTTRVVVTHISLLKLCVLLCSPLDGVTLPSCTTSQGSSCLFNHSCSTDHSSQVLDCSRGNTTINTTGSIYTGYNITDCRPGKLCASKLPHLPDEDKFLVSSVRVQVMPVNVSHFAITVYWEWRPFDYNRSLNKLQGYELRIIKGSTTQVNSTLKCLCIREPSLRNVSLIFDKSFQYNSSSSLRMNVELSTFPVDIDWPETQYTEYHYTAWPSICSGSSVCLPPLPPAPIASMPQPVLLKDGLKTLKLSWTEPDSNVNMYYIQLVSPNSENLTFFVNGSNYIKVTGLSSATRWSARIRGFSPCSGLAAFYSGKSNVIGCGQWSDPLAEILPYTMEETSTSIFISSSQPISILAISLMVIIPLIFIVVAIGLACVYLYFRLHKMETVNHYPVLPMTSVHYDKPGKLDALVLYSPGSPEQERIEIERDIVAYLKLHHFRVVSCNDHTEKTVMQWAEENARLACAVFIVCNKTFYLEWKMNSRTQLVNSIDMIVASAVGQNKIKKYATVLLRPGDDKYVPDNLYFRGMKSFLINSRASKEEKSRFISFIKLNSNMSW